MRAGFLVFSVAALMLAGLSANANAESTPPPPPNKRNCQNTIPFNRWLADFKREALSEGIRPETIEETIGGMTPDQGTIGRDRKQGFFSQTFIEFYFKLATKGREQMGRTYLQRYRPIFDRAEKEFGVPGAVITGFWALESDFGGGMGKLPVMHSLVTLAWDCRRGDMFREELKAAMKIVQRGDLTPDQMIGSWAGELGQTQFLPRHYLNYGIDYDGDGRVDLIRSNDDVIGSTAKFLASMGWRRGEPWLEEVRVTKELPWDKADLAIQLPRSQWVAWGIEGVGGKRLPADGLQASLLLPMGRNGPAFLAYPNFLVYTQWNQSLTYAMTAAHLAARMAGAPNLSRESGNVASLSYEQLKELQNLLKRRGFDVGEIDGKLGAGTRKAVKEMQIKFGLPADSYPTAELLTALRGRS
ncbi:lytic murein transglycosylase [Hyphomicrobium sp.]|uniref:lytic murein transglycosylase n=1 Tax=Hyphomicrobium sp. TaxID=82 RepID=UPI000FB36DEB|nr:lytic murein transglycosylase [Hyphomicrobium sp.]RUP08695.1 MAG: lytic murein transglycosylase [Hyphomicrobium sp.]